MTRRARSVDRGTLCRPAVCAVLALAALLLPAASLASSDATDAEHAEKPAGVTEEEEVGRQKDADLSGARSIKTRDADVLVSAVVSATPGCDGRSSGATFADVRLDRPLPAVALAVECRFATVSESNAWSGAWTDGHEGAGGVPVWETSIPRRADATEDAFWSKVGRRVASVGGDTGVGHGVTPGVVSAGDGAVVRCSLPALGGVGPSNLAVESVQGNLTVVVAWKEPGGGTGGDASATWRVTRPGMEAHALLPYASRVAEVAVQPFSFNPRATGDLVEVFGVGFDDFVVDGDGGAGPAACGFDGIAPVLTHSGLQREGETHYRRSTVETPAVAVTKTRLGCRPPPATMHVHAVRVRWPARVIAAGCDVGSEAAAVVSATLRRAPVVAMTHHEIIASKSGQQKSDQATPNKELIKVDLHLTSFDALLPVTAVVELREITVVEGTNLGLFSKGNSQSVTRKTIDAVRVRWKAGESVGTARSVALPIATDLIDVISRDGVLGERFEVVVTSVSNGLVAASPLDTSSLITAEGDNDPPTFVVVPHAEVHRPHPTVNNGLDAGGMRGTSFLVNTTASESNTTTLVSARHTNATVTVKLVSGRSSLPSVLFFSTTQSGTAVLGKEFLGVSGILTWDTSDAAEATRERTIDVPVLWNGVEDVAEVSVGVTLVAIWNAHAPVNLEAEKAAFWIYGVEKGSCPRGTERVKDLVVREARLVRLQVATAMEEEEGRLASTYTALMVPTFEPVVQSYLVALSREASLVVINFVLFDAAATARVLEGDTVELVSLKRVEEKDKEENATAPASVNITTGSDGNFTFNNTETVKLETASREYVAVVRLAGISNAVSITVTTPDGSKTEVYVINVSMPSNTVNAYPSVDTLALSVVSGAVNADVALLRNASDARRYAISTSLPSDVSGLRVSLSLNVTNCLRRNWMVAAELQRSNMSIVDADSKRVAVAIGGTESGGMRMVSLDLEFKLSDGYDMVNVTIAGGGGKFTSTHMIDLAPTADQKAAFNASAVRRAMSETDAPLPSSTMPHPPLSPFPSPQPHLPPSPLVPWTAAIAPANRPGVCHHCSPGWFTDQVDASACRQCRPGTAASTPVRALSCDLCRPGWYSRLPAQTECLPCIVGTFSSFVGSTSCRRCNGTTVNEGSVTCDVEDAGENAAGKEKSPRLPSLTGEGITVTTKISFGAMFDILVQDDNGFTLAALAGVEDGDMSDEYVVMQLMRSDCAKRFNIPISQVTVYNVVRSEMVLFINETDGTVAETQMMDEHVRVGDESLDASVEGPAAGDRDGVSRVSSASTSPITPSQGHARMRVERRVLISANVTAVLESHFPPSATEEDILAALEVQQLSADNGVQMLSDDPDAFFGRTTQTLNAKGKQTSEVTVTVSTQQAPTVTVRDPDWSDGLPMDASTFFVMCGGVFILMLAGGRRAVAKVMKVMPRGIWISTRIVRAGGRRYNGMRSRRGSPAVLGGGGGGGGNAASGGAEERVHSGGMVDAGTVSLSIHNAHRRTNSRGGSVLDLQGLESAV